MIDWENLHYFAVFAREKSLSAAARVLRVDHATVARRIAALEAALQLKLVDRRARIYTLTCDGERISKLACQMDEGAFSIERVARAGQQQVAGEVSLSVPPSTAAAFIVPRLGQLRAAYPGIHLRIIAETRLASLPRGEADIAVRLVRPTEEGLVGRKLGVLPFGFYAAPQYVAATPPEQYEFIALDDSLDHSLQQHWLRAVIGSRQVVIRTNTPEIQRIAATAGVGVVVLPDFLGKAATATGGLVRLDMGEAPMFREIWLAVHADLHHTPTVRAVMDFLIDCFAELG